MNAVAERLPLPVGARFAAPARRSRLDAWAAPRSTELVLDPWAAPVGLPIARVSAAPWSAPSPAARITWMPSPASLLPPPMGHRAIGDMAVATPDASVATARAIATLRALADSPQHGIHAGSPAELLHGPVGAAGQVNIPSSEPPATLSLVDPLPPLLGIELEIGKGFAPPDAGAAVVGGRSIARWRLAAIVGGVGAATVAVVTLLTSAF